MEYGPLIAQHLNRCLCVLSFVDRNNKKTSCDAFLVSNDLAIAPATAIWDIANK